MMRSLRALALGLVACGGNPAQPAAPSPSTQSSLLGKPAPAGKVVVVKFVAKYCEPCTRTLPAIERLHAKHPEIQIIAISEDEREAEAKELVATYHLTFPMVHDNQQVLSARYRVRELPVTYILDGKGNVAWVGGPEKSEADLVTAIETARP